MLTFKQVEDSERITTDAGKHEVRICCFECEDTKFHCYCNLEKKVYYCHKCGARGRISYTHADYAKGMEEVSKAIKEAFNIPGKREDQQLYKSLMRPKKTLPLNGLVYGFLGNTYNTLLYNNTYDYLYKRGITKDLMEKYDIRFSVEQSGIFKDCIIFPIYAPMPDRITAPQRLEYFVCRRYTDQQPKYINAPWPKGAAMFKCEREIILKDSLSINEQDMRNDTVVLTEGIFDAIAISKSGYRATALLGKTATQEQLKRVSKWTDRFIIYLDHDAFTHAINLKLQLIALGKKSEIITPMKQDASDLSISNPKELRRLLDGACGKLWESK